MIGRVGLKKYINYFDTEYLSLKVNTNIFKDYI